MYICGHVNSPGVVKCLKGTRLYEDAEGKRVKEVVDGKKKTVYDEVQKEIKKDAPSRLHARRQMMKVFYPVKEVPAKGAGRKKNTNQPPESCWR